MRPLIALLVTLALPAGAWGQSGMYAEPGGLDGPPDGLRIPNDAARQMMTNGGGAAMPEPIDLGDVLDSSPYCDPYGIQFDDRAPIESTGTWLQRGYWFTEQDVVIYNHSPFRDEFLLATDSSGQRRFMAIRPRHAAAFANMRMTIGRFMFRDQENRDHFTEVTFLGGGQKFQEGAITAFATNGLQTPNGLDRFNDAFDGSNVQVFEYTHEMASLEFNYHVKRRMQRDQMVLLPEGRWVRRAAPTKTKELFVGMRWVAIAEWLEWQAFGGRNGEMRVNIDNNLLGFQIGGGVAREFARFSLGLRGKAGAYVNFADLGRRFVIRNGNTNVGTVVQRDSVSLEEEALAFVGELNAIARYHIHQNFSLRASAELLYVNEIGVAPFNVTFVPSNKIVDVSNDSLYFGFSFGIEGYW